MRSVVWFLAFFAALNIFGQNPELSVEKIMQGHEFVGYLPDSIQWSSDSKNIYFKWNPENESVQSLYSIDIETKNTQKVNNTEQIQGFLSHSNASGT